MISHTAAWINLASYVSHLCSKEWNCGLWVCMKINLILLKTRKFEGKKLGNVTILVIRTLWWLESLHSYACELLVSNAQKHNAASTVHLIPSLPWQLPNISCSVDNPALLVQNKQIKICTRFEKAYFFMNSSHCRSYVLYKD